MPRSPGPPYAGQRSALGGASEGAWADQGDRLATVLFALALLLAFVRFVALSRWSLWLDEAFTLSDSLYRRDLRNPIGYGLFGLLYRLDEGRPGEFALRLPAALFGCASVGLTVWAFRPFVRARVAGLAALIVALSSWHVYWSQNARFYTLAQFLALLGGAWVLRGVLWRLPGQLAAGFGVVLLGALVHPSVALFGCALLAAPWILRGLGVLRRSRRTRSVRVWRVLTGAVLLTLFAGSGWMLEVWTAWDRHKGTGDALHYVLSTGFLLTPFLGLGFVYGLSFLFRGAAPAAALAGLAAAGTLGMGLMLSFFARVSAQYVFVALPWIALLAALPLQFPGRIRPVLYVLFLALPLALDTGLYFGVRNGDRPPWREAYTFVFEERGPQDLVLGMEAPVGEYYWNPTKDDLRRWGDVVWLDGFRSRLAEDWARSSRRTWLVVNHEQLQDWARADREALVCFLEENCRLARSFAVGWTPRDLDVHVYVRE